VDPRLKICIENATRDISSYMERCGPVSTKQEAAIHFHLIQAKQALMRAFAIYDPSEFVPRRLISVYDEQLEQLSMFGEKPIS
jgi:hypothetical protein